MTESGKRQEVLRLYPNGNSSKIPFHFRIGTKLIVGFLIIASITGSRIFGFELRSIRW
ncbi:MAG: hypothetical protein WB706_03135 [Nitrososphaeraceae archaeon]